MKKEISKTRRSIEAFLWIGFFTLFITLAVGQVGSKVGTGVMVPLKSKAQDSYPTSIDDYIDCDCYNIYSDQTKCIEIHDQEKLEGWINNHPQLPLTRLKTDPGVVNSVMDVKIELNYKNRNGKYLILRISKQGRIYLFSQSEGNCEAYSSTCCCFYYQNICRAMSWLFPWIEFNCWQTFWKCWIWADCYKNDYYHNMLFWILLEFFYCCDDC